MQSKYIFTILTLWVATADAANNYSLPEAIKKQLVTIKIHGAKPNQGEAFYNHYGPCLSMEVINTSTDALQLNLDDGYKLEPSDTSYQTMMVTRNLTLTLLAKQKQSCRIYAMCCKATHAGPNTETSFAMGKRATGYLLQLAQLIDHKNYQCGAAQSAVWCLTNNEDISTIESTDTAMMYGLRRFVALAKNIPAMRVYSSVGQNNPFSEPEPPRITYTATINYSIPNTRKVMIGLYDETGTPKIIYVNNETQREGDYTYKYQISSAQIGDKKHYLRVYTDGKLYHEMSLVPQ